MKEYECVQVNHHQDVGPTIEEYIDAGWQLHTYQTSGDRSMGGVKHYLLFEKEG
jgi:hypothetical protein